MQNTFLALSFSLLLGAASARCESTFVGETYLDPQLNLSVQPLPMVEDLSRLYDFWPSDEFDSRQNDFELFQRQVAAGQTPARQICFRHELATAAHPVFALIAASAYGRELLKQFIPRYLAGDIPVFPTQPVRFNTLSGPQALPARVLWWWGKGRHTALLVTPQTELGWLVFQMTWAMHLALDPTYFDRMDDLQPLVAEYQRLQEKLQPSEIQYDQGGLLFTVGPQTDFGAHARLQDLAYQLEYKKLEAYVFHQRAAYDAANRVVRELADLSRSAKSYYERAELEQHVRMLTPFSGGYFERMIGTRLPPALRLGPGCRKLIGDLGNTSPPPPPMGPFK